MWQSAADHSSSRPCPALLTLPTGRWARRTCCWALSSATADTSTSRILGGACALAAADWAAHLGRGARRLLGAAVLKSRRWRRPARITAASEEVAVANEPWPACATACAHRRCSQSLPNNCARSPGWLCPPPVPCKPGRWRLVLHSRFQREFSQPNDQRWPSFLLPCACCACVALHFLCPLWYRIPSAQPHTAVNTSRIGSSLPCARGSGQKAPPSPGHSGVALTHLQPQRPPELARRGERNPATRQPLQCTLGAPPRPARATPPGRQGTGSR